MSEVPYIEDIFLEFYETILISNRVSIQHQDRSASASFYTIIDHGKPLTKNQGNYVLRILEKYKNTSRDFGLNYIEEIKNPKWRYPFRVIDMTRKIFIERDNDDEICVCLKFPYQLLDEFDAEIFPTADDSAQSTWDSERRIRKIRLYDANLVHLYDFCKKHQFEIDDSFFHCLSQVEEIWQNQDEIISKSFIENGIVFLKNAGKDAEDWFENHKKGEITNDLFLAKSMGFLYSKPPKTHIERIASKETNMFFWKYPTYQLFEICKKLDGKIAIILDRSEETFEWLKKITESAEQAGFENNEIKVAFRNNKNDEYGLNEWVSTRGYGGKMSEGKIYVFNHKPPKWLFKDKIPVTMLITNALFPATTKLTREWLSSHPCVMFVNGVEPTPYSEIEIGKL